MMNQLKVGDIVYLNSDKTVPMTVAYISDGEIQCIYFNEAERKFVQTMAMPKEVLTLSKALQPEDDYYK